jgi:ribosomal-protein-alanine acetyltransferase
MKAVPINLRPLELADLDAILAIQRLSPEAAQWSRSDYARFVRSGELGGKHAAASGPDVVEICRESWVAEAEGKLVGFIVARSIAGETEILNLGVEPAFRRSGIGSLLLKQAITHAEGVPPTRAFLEVRESNHGAIAFYLRHGFSVAGRRAQYYSDPREDGLILSRSLL